MCDPVSISIGLAATGALMQGASMFQQANAAEAEGKASAQISEYNAKIKERAAEDAINRGGQSSAVIRENARKINARGHAMGSAAGVDMGSGTALDILTENAGTGELDALTALNNAQREAYGYKVGAASDLYQAKTSRIIARQKALSLRIGGAGTLVSGFGGAASKLPSSSSSGYNYATSGPLSYANGGSFQY